MTKNKFCSHKTLLKTRNLKAKCLKLAPIAHYQAKSISTHVYSTEIPHLSLYLYLIQIPDVLHNRKFKLTTLSCNLFKRYCHLVPE